MKFFAFNVRIDEQPFIEAWAQENGIEVSQTSAFLTRETVGQAAGFDGISSLQTTPYKRDLFEEMKRLNLHYLALRNVGTDNIDLAAAAENGVTISNVPAYSPNAIAEFAVLQALNLLRKTKTIEQQQQASEFHWSAGFLGREMREQTVGVIGTGKIGGQAASLFQGLGAKVIAYTPDPESRLDQVTYVNSVDELLPQADVITLHAPGNPDNFHMLDAAAFKKMKSTAILINTARGSLVDLEALKQALDSHEIAGAALDAFENETAAMQQFDAHAKLEGPLLTELALRDNVLISPHMAFHTDVAVTNMVSGSLNSLLQFNESGHADFEV